MKRKTGELNMDNLTLLLDEIKRTEDKLLEVMNLQDTLIDQVTELILMKLGKENTYTQLLLDFDKLISDGVNQDQSSVNQDQWTFKEDKQ